MHRSRLRPVDVRSFMIFLFCRCSLHDMWWVGIISKTNTIWINNKYIWVEMQPLLAFVIRVENSNLAKQSALISFPPLKFQLTRPTSLTHLVGNPSKSTVNNSQSQQLLPFKDIILNTTSRSLLSTINHFQTQD